MSIGISKITDDAFALLKTGRVIPALQELIRARDMTRIPERWLFLTFNIGVLYWDKLGDGVAAKREFVAAADMEGLEMSPIRVLQANALENLMLSASSFEEFDAFSERLRLLAPGEPVLEGLPPEVHSMRDSGKPWSAVLIRLAMSNYNRNDPALDRGRYGVAKSTYHILLQERRQQRLSREDWRLAILEYCALGMRMTTDCMHLRGGDADWQSPEEFLPILTESLPFVDEYLQIYSGDDIVRKYRQNMDVIISDLRQRWRMVAPGLPPRPSMMSRPGLPRTYHCRQCHKAILDPMRPCQECGHPSGPMMTFPIILTLAIMAVVVVWHILGYKPLWIRGVSAVAAALFILIIIGPIMFHASLGLMSDND